MATKKKTPKARTPKRVEGTPREHRAIDARKERERVKKLPKHVNGSA